MRDRPGGALAAVLLFALLAVADPAAVRATDRAPVTAGPSEAHSTLDTSVVLGPERLASRLDRILSDPALARAHVGMKVMVAETGQVLYERSAERRFIPASNVKLVTAAVALDALGPDHRWTTRLYGSGTVRGGTLEGDLWIVGDGDPRLTREEVDRWTGLVARAGIRRIAGDVVGDDRSFAPPPWPEGWTWGDLYSGWGVGSTALQLHPGRILAKLHPGDSLGLPTRLELRGQGPLPALENRARTGAPGSAVRLRFLPPDGELPLRLVGWIPSDGEPVNLTLAPGHPTRHLLGFLEDRLEAAGIAVDGRFRRAGPGETRSGAAWTASSRSEPLRDVLPRLLQRSDNQIAESLLRSIGREAGDGGSPEEGLEVVADGLAGWGVDPDAVRLTDGSGLSRYDQITPAALVRMLRAVWREPGFTAFSEALPAAAEDGTLTGRLLGTPAAGNLRGKTGSLSNVRALSGYVEDGAGRTLVFSLLLNGYDAPGAVAEALEDLVVEQLSLLGRPVVPGWPEFRRPGG